jgi:hypothetical protein
MRVWFWRWLRVGTGIALLGGLLWLTVECELSSDALLRSAVWGLMWIGLEYAQAHEERRMLSNGWS